MAKECMLSTDKLPLRGLPRNSVVRLTDHPDKASVFTVDAKLQIKQNDQVCILSDPEKIRTNSWSPIYLLHSIKCIFCIL